MFVEGPTLELGEIECDRVGVVGILAQQVVSSQVVFGQLDELLWRGGLSIWKYLMEYMCAELLDAYLVVSRRGLDCEDGSVDQVGDWAIEKGQHILARLFFFLAFAFWATAAIHRACARRAW